MRNIGGCFVIFPLARSSRHDAGSAPAPEQPASQPARASLRAAGGADDEIAPEAAAPGCVAVVVRSESPPPAAGGIAPLLSQSAADAVAKEAAAASRRLDLLENQLGRVALAVRAAFPTVVLFQS